MGIVDNHLCMKLYSSAHMLTYQHSTNLNGRRSVCRFRRSFFCSVKMMSFGRHSALTAGCSSGTNLGVLVILTLCSLNIGVTSTSTDIIYNSCFECSQITLQGSDPGKVSFTAGAEPNQLLVATNYLIQTSPDFTAQLF